MKPDKTETQWRRGWKVLGSKRASCFVCLDWGGVQYPKGIEARPKPKCGPLAVFRTKEGATKFMDKSLIRDKVVPCRYLPSSKDALHNQYLRDSLDIDRCPDGTALASVVVCLA